MTEPTPFRRLRPTASTITDAELDRLYEMRDQVARTGDRYRTAWHSARDRARRSVALEDQLAAVRDYVRHSDDNAPRTRETILTILDGDQS